MDGYPEPDKTDNREYEIMMSPMLAEKLQEISNRLSKIEESIKDNREIYINTINTINIQAEENAKILKENRQIYEESVKKIGQLEQKNKEEIDPIIQKMKINSDILEKSGDSSFEQSRIYNRIMRKGRIPSTLNSTQSQSIIPGLLGVPFLHTNAYNKNSSIGSLDTSNLEGLNIDEDEPVNIDISFSEESSDES